MKKQFYFFVFRWLVNSIILGFFIYLFNLASKYTISTFIFAGLIFTIMNSMVKPIVTILSLPMIILTLGIFTLVINGIIVWISLCITPNVSIRFVDAVTVGIVMSIVNYIITSRIGLIKIEEELNNEF